MYLTPGDDIEGWTIEKDFLGPWLQYPGNKTILRDEDGVDFEDLPFFQWDLNPGINEKGNKLMCKYSFGFLCKDVKEGLPLFFLTHDASPGQIAVVKKLEEEKPYVIFHRLLKWGTDLQDSQAFTRQVVIESSFGFMLTPKISHLEKEEDLDLKFKRDPQRRCAKNYMYCNLNFQDSKRNTKRFKLFNTEGKWTVQKEKRWNNDVEALSFKEHDGILGNFYYGSYKDLNIKSPQFYFTNCFFDIVGTLKLRADMMTLGDKNEHFTFECMGPLTLQPLSRENCPIKKINIYPANPDYRTGIMGTVNFGPIPEINLEVLNVDRIHIIQKK